MALLKQVKGVGTLIALTFLLRLEEAHGFRKSRDVGCYLGLQPGGRSSGQSEPQMHIRNEGDPYLRTLLVQGAHPILGPFGADSDLRRWGLWVTLFLPRRVATVATLPSALFDERFSLGTSWVFSFQPVLPPVYRPRFHLEDESWARRLTQSPPLVESF